MSTVAAIEQNDYNAVTPFCVAIFELNSSKPIRPAVEDFVGWKVRC
jgi:hypothetical protein